MSAVALELTRQATGTLARIETAMTEAVGSAQGPGCPPRLAAAVRHAVFPGGARIRPQLCLAVAAACGDDLPALSTAAAISIELMHCASLVHDDLPCFDNAAMRRGQPSVHAAFGERLAVLSGDALIVLALQVVARVATASDNPSHAALRCATVLSTVAQGVGMPLGIAAGQAWECEPRVDLADYQRAKTGALFVAATMAGAQAAGGDASQWRNLGEWLGEAYQVADDIRDAAADPAVLGKPVGQDVALGRPSAAIQLGLGGALAHFEELIDAAAAAVPPCRGAKSLKTMVRMESERLVPKAMAEELRRISA